MSVKFSKEAEKRFEVIVARYPQKGAALLPVLWLAQEEFEWLAPEVRKYVAEKLDLSLARVESVISFYTLYRREPMGKHHVQVCRNISCVLRGAQNVMTKIEETLGLQPGQTSADGIFSYSKVECIAACGGAPAMQIDGKYYDNLTDQKVEEILGRFREDGSNRH